MEPIDKPAHDQPAEGGDIPDAGPGASHGRDEPLANEKRDADELDRDPKKSSRANPE